MDRVGGMIDDDLVASEDSITWRPPPGEWAEQAACLDEDPDLFFPERGASTARAVAICGTCPVRLQCLEHAMRVGEKHGIWGGLSERQRRRIRKNIQPVARGAA